VRVRERKMRACCISVFLKYLFGECCDRLRNKGRHKCSKPKSLNRIKHTLPTQKDTQMAERQKDPIYHTKSATQTENQRIKKATEASEAKRHVRFGRGHTLLIPVPTCHTTVAKLLYCNEFVSHVMDVIGLGVGVKL